MSTPTLERPLKTEGTNWAEDDDIRLIHALDFPFSKYTLSCIGTCCNTISDLADTAVTNIRELLDQYEAAESAIKEQNLADKEGKKLVKADVLEWETVSGGKEGLTKELLRTRYEISRYFSSCTCLAPLLDNVVPAAAVIRS